MVQEMVNQAPCIELAGEITQLDAKRYWEKSG